MIFDYEHQNQPLEEPEDFLRLWSAEEYNEALQDRIHRLKDKQATTEGMLLGLCFVSFIFAVGAIGAGLGGVAVCFGVVFLVATAGVWLGRD